MWEIVGNIAYNKGSRQLPSLRDFSKHGCHTSYVASWHQPGMFNIISCPKRPLPHLFWLLLDRILYVDPSCIHVQGSNQNPRLACRGDDPFVIAPLYEPPSLHDREGIPSQTNAWPSFEGVGCVPLGSHLPKCMKRCYYLHCCHHYQPTYALFLALFVSIMLWSIMWWRCLPTFSSLFHNLLP